MRIADLLRSPAETRLDEDAVFEVLGSWRRRFMIEHLDDVETTSKADLAEAIAFVEDDDADTLDAIDEKARKAAYVSLHQTHLPLLETYGVISVDEWDLVSKTGECAALASIIRAVRDRVAE